MTDPVWQCFRTALKACCTNMACAPFFMVAIIFYAFYYCWPYYAQLPEHIHVCIVDEDDSPFSRRLIMKLRASAQINVIRLTNDREVAIGAMQDGSVSSIIGIPENFERDILSGIPTALSLVSNGVFIVKFRSVKAGMGGPLSEITGEAISKQLVEYGIPLSTLTLKELQPPMLVIQNEYNVIGGYLNFVAPIVFVIIFQTLMVCGTGMLYNSWFNMTPAPQILQQICSSPLLLFASQLPVALICLLWIVLIEGAVFGIYGINSFQNVAATFMAGVCFSLAVSSAGVLAGLLFQKRNYVIQLVVTSSIPCVFITGNLFPVENIPVYMRAISWFLPSTPGSDAMLRASQAGASSGEIVHYLLHLLALAVLYFAFAWLAAKKARKTFV